MRRTTRLASLCLVAVAVLASCADGNDRVAGAPTTTTLAGTPATSPTDATGDDGRPTTTGDAATPGEPTGATEPGGDGAATTVPSAGETGTSTSAPTGVSTASSVASSSSVPSSPRPTTSSSVKPSTSSSVAPSTSTKPPATTTGSPGSKSFDAYDGSGSPKTFTVQKGTEVTITVHSPMVHEYHLHGYDLLNSGTVVSFSFTADMTGSFIVENHDNGALVCTLVVN